MTVLAINFYTPIEFFRKLLKKIHKEIIINGDFIKNYDSIYSSLLFDDSYDNRLLQLTDFIAGCFAGVLTSIYKTDINNYTKAIELFCDTIYPKICINDKGEIWGVGIKETPKQNDLRKKYKAALSTLIDKYYFF